MSAYRLSVLASLAVLAVLLLCWSDQAFGARIGQDVAFQYDQPPAVTVQQQKRQGASKYCGKKLSNTLQLICHGVYNSMFKKSGGSNNNQETSNMEDYQWAYDDSSYPFRTRASANAMMARFGGGRFRRDSRGVYDECCAKSCTMSELLSYCAVKPH